MKKMSPTPENIKYTKTLIYQNKEKLKEIITMNNLKNSWKIIKEMIGKVDHHKVKKHTTFLINNQYSTDSKIISNQFN